MIDIEKLADEYGAYIATEAQGETPFMVRGEMIFDAESLYKFAEAYAAKVLEDKEREIAELQSNINELREALEYWSKVINYQYTGNSEAMSFIQNADDLTQQVLSKTPAQSLQAFENEVIEKCAKVCDEAGQPNKDEIHTDAQWAAKVLAANIRALKVTND